MTSILEGLRTGAWRLVPVEPNDKMMLMGGFRFAGRVPNSEVFKEVRKGWDDMLSASPDATAAMKARSPAKPSPPRPVSRMQRRPCLLLRKMMKSNAQHDSP